MDWRRRVSRENLCGAIQALGDGELSLVGRSGDPCFRRKENALKSRVFEYKTIF